MTIIHHHSRPHTKNMLSTIMQTISRKAGLSTMYTNHCVRATTITSLFQACVDSKRICSITKHKNEATLSHYIASTTDEQKREASSVLSCSLTGGNVSVNKMSGDEKSCVDMVPSIDLSHEVQAQSSQQSIDRSTKDLGVIQNFLSGGQFTNCTFNFSGLTGQANDM